MVLCAGYGTRLYPLTDELPKPLVPIGDAPLLAHVARRLRDGGVGRLVANAHHLPEALVATGGALGLEVVCEARILGTAGGVRHAAGALGEGASLVVNGDILAELDAAALARAHEAHGPFATLAVADVGPAGSGTVGLDDAGAVVRLRSERFGIETRGAAFVGAQVLSNEARSALPEEGCLVGDVYLPALRRGARVLAAATVGRWWDVGTPAAYLACNLAWLADRGARAWREGRAWAEADEVAGVRAQDTILGDGVRLEGAGRLDEVIAWPGSVVRAPLSRAIVTPRGVVPVSNL